jgi:hypothetical protein
MGGLITEGFLADDDPLEDNENAGNIHMLEDEISDDN